MIWFWRSNLGTMCDSNSGAHPVFFPQKSIEIQDVLDLEKDNTLHSGVYVVSSCIARHACLDQWWV